MASTGEYDALTDQWLEILNGSVPYEEMTDVLSILASNGKENLATELLELTIAEKEIYGEKGFSTFLLKSAKIFGKSEPLRKALIEVIRDEYLMFQPLEYFLKLSGFKKDNADVSSSWRLFTSLMKYRKDRYLYHRTFGVGQISRINRTHATIDFQKARDHDMKLDVALETTIPLDSDSLAVLSWKNADEFSRLFKESTSEFLERLAKEQPGNHGEISIQDLPVLFDSSEFVKSEVWKILKKTATGTNGFAIFGDRIVLLDQNVDFLEQIKNIIDTKKVSVSEKTRQVQALLKSCCTRFPHELTALLENVRSLSSPETGSLFELCWILTNRGTAKEFTEIQSDYLENTAARGERAIGEIRSISCRKDYLHLFFSGKTEKKEMIKLLSGLRRSLWEYAASILKESDPELLSDCIGYYLSKPSETDRFLWSLCFLASHEEKWDDSLEENQMGLFLDNLIFSSADTQKKVITLLMGPLKLKLADYLSSIDTRMLNNYLDSFNTSATAQNEGLCLLLGRSVSLRKNSAMRKSGKRFFWETDALFSSRKAIEQRKADAIHLKQVEIPAAAEDIGEAASHGDLSENAEYAAAIEKRDLLLDRLNRWTKELQNYRSYPSDEISSDIISPGVRVQLQKTDGSETVKTVDLVGPLDANPEKGRINYMAPLGKAILGKSLGDIVVLQ
jgi:transcription elongation factor GreA